MHVHAADPLWTLPISCLFPSHVHYGDLNCIESEEARNASAVGLHQGRRTCSAARTPAEDRIRDFAEEAIGGEGFGEELSASAKGRHRR